MVNGMEQGRVDLLTASRYGLQQDRTKNWSALWSLLVCPLVLAGLEEVIWGQK